MQSLFKFLKNNKGTNTPPVPDSLNYCKTAAPIISEICQPLYNFGVTVFTYSRIFNSNGRRLYVCSNKDWVEHYLLHDYQDELDHLEHYVPLTGTKYALWSGFKMDRVFSAALNEFSYWHGFTLYKRYKDYVDYFDFGTHKENHQMIGFYINNIELFDKFTLYFKTKASVLIDPSDQNKLIIPKVWVPFNEIPRASMNIDKLSKPEQKNRFRSGPTRILEKDPPQLRNFSMSERERQVLLSLSRGKTIREIAQIMNLSLRTVECYITNLKLKTNCRTRSELIDLTLNTEQHLFISE